MKRLAEDWVLLLGVFAGMMVTTLLVAGAAVYLRSLDQLAFNTSLDRLGGRILNIDVFAPNLRLTHASLREAEERLDDAIERNISAIDLGYDVYIKGGVSLVGLPTRPLPAERGTGEAVARGYLQHLSGLEARSRFVQGKMAGSSVSTGPRGPELEAVISTQTANSYDLKVGDVVLLTADLGTPVISALIVGVIEPADSTDEYWNKAGLFIDPAPLGEPPLGIPPPPGIEVNGDEPAVALLVTRAALVDSLSLAHPRSLVKPIWFMMVDKEGLKEWSMSEALDRLGAFGSEITGGMPGASVSTGILRGMVDDVRRRSFFSTVPLLLLLAVLVVTVLFFLAMMVASLAQSRERDAGLLQTRGVGTLQLMRLYAVEGLLMTVVSVAVAPFLAMGAVALAGRLPSFRNITGDALLPVEIGPAPFLLAAGAGLVCLAIYAVPSALGTRRGLLAHKLRSSRPPTMPVFHRYYVDLALVSLGGLVFWELRSRGHLISGGLFSDVQVDETMLLAPVLFLVAVALLFMRLFPLLVRFISGESPALVHLLVTAVVAFLAPAIVLRTPRESDAVSWLGPAALVLAVAAVYYATNRVRGPALRSVGLLLQGGLVVAFVALEPPEPGQPLFAPAIALISIVPAQVAFSLLRLLVRAAPVWLSTGLWHMARNPLQYSWLVLLLVLTTGVVVLATTVGGTLEKSQGERVLYDVGADLRVSAFSRSFVGGIRGLKETYLEMPGVAAVALALRVNGSIGSGNAEVLALESAEVPRVAWWYREDFSDGSLNGIIRALQPRGRVEPIAIPEGAATVGLWIRPVESSPYASMWMVLSDGAGEMRTLSLGGLGPPEWHVLTADLPPELEPPVSLVSVQVFEPGSLLTPQTLLVDDLHVSMGPGEECPGEECVLEGFEGSDLSWTPIVTSLLPSDTVASTGLEAHGGERALVFSAGAYSNRSVRGFYRGNTAGSALPVVVSSSLVASSGYGVGDLVIGSIAGRLVPLSIQDEVDYFPTMSPYRGGFILADLDSLLSYLNMFGHPSRLEPNELYIGRTPGLDGPIGEVEDRRTARFVTVEDRASMLESLQADPFATAGWRATVLVALGIAVLAATLGYVAYLLLFANRSRIEVGFLQSMGLSRRQLTGLIGFEHLTIVSIGLGLGTWSGFQMSSLMVSTLAVTELGERVVPPYILTTDWNLMLPAYAALVAVSLVALALLNRGIGRPDLRSIARISD